MKIAQIYEKYEIMPQLSLHMRRVAAVGKLILDGWKGEIDQDLVIRTLLLHDMGNIVKFDLINLLMPIENIEHWREVQRRWLAKYGKDTYTVTRAVAVELGQSDVAAVFSEEHAGYLSGKAEQILERSDAAKILAYADVRVKPDGVVPMPERIADLQKRYGREMGWYDFLYKLEKEIARMTGTNLARITDSEVAPQLDKLLTYEIECS